MAEWAWDGLGQVFMQKKLIVHIPGYSHMNQVQEQNPQCKKDSGMCSKESTLKLALGCWISAKM